MQFFLRSDRYASWLIAVGLTGASCQKFDHGILQKTALTSGSGTVWVGSNASAVPAFSFGWGGDGGNWSPTALASPAGEASIVFAFDFGTEPADVYPSTSARVECDAIAIDLKDHTPIPLQPGSCALAISVATITAASTYPVVTDYSASLGSATLNANADLDDNGDGRITIQLDLDDVTSATQGGDSEAPPITPLPPLSASVLLQSLTGVAWFGDRPDNGSASAVVITTGPGS